MAELVNNGKSNAMFKRRQKSNQHAKSEQGDSGSNPFNNICRGKTNRVVISKWREILRAALYVCN